VASHSCMSGRLSGGLTDTEASAYRDGTAREGHRPGCSMHEWSRINEVAFPVLLTSRAGSSSGSERDEGALDTESVRRPVPHPCLHSSVASYAGSLAGGGRTAPLFTSLTTARK